MVIYYINSFPREESHYSQSKSQKEYLSLEPNTNKLFNAFKKKRPECTITYKFYRQVVMKDFLKLPFKISTVNTCKTCGLLFF